MLLSNPSAGLQELIRLLKPGASVGMTTWEQVGWVQDVREAFESNDELPAFPTDAALRKAFSTTEEIWHEPEAVKKHLVSHGFVDVNVQSKSITTNFTIDEFVGIMPGTVGMITGRCFTPEQREKYKLLAEQTAETYTRKKYGKEAVVWNWTAIVATARKPK